MADKCQREVLELDNRELASRKQIFNDHDYHNVLIS